MLKKLKKLGAGIALTGVAFIGVSFATVLPAQASETSKQAICHDTGSGKFVQNTVAKESIVKGGHGNSGVNAGDIVPPFDYNFGGEDHGAYSGKNWTDENKALWANSCNPANVILTPDPIVAPVQTCANQNPTFSVPLPTNGLNVSSSDNGSGVYTVLYELPKNTAHKTYTFPEDFVNPVTVTTVDNRPLDIYWDSAKGACNLPDTGAGSVNSVHILYAGGLIGAGLIVTALNRRKTS